MNRHFSLSQIVKLVSCTVALSGAIFAAPAFAADTAASDTSNPQVVASVAQPDTQVHQKTRAEVYQELVDAERSGELARLNALYGGS